MLTVATLLWRAATLAMASDWSCCRHCKSVLPPAAVGLGGMASARLLVSMEKHPAPTRAGVGDIFDTVLGGPASLMVTGKTAIDRYLVQTM